MPFDDTTLGFIAAVFTTVSFLPQAIQTFRTKKTRDISLYTYLTLVMGMFMWLGYGIMIHAIPLITTNLVSLLFAVPILILKIKNG